MDLWIGLARGMISREGRQGRESTLKSVCSTKCRRERGSSREKGTKEAETAGTGEFTFQTLRVGQARVS